MEGLGSLMGGPLSAVTGLFGQVAQELGKEIGQAVNQQGGESQPAGGQNAQEPFHQVLQDLQQG
jgi:hypothetical protein